VPHAREPEVAEDVTTDATAGAANTDVGEHHVVIQRGDDLIHIVRRVYGYADDDLLDAVQRANPEKLVNRNLLTPGDTLFVPPDPWSANDAGPAATPNGGGATP